jgi:hypothetical protein
MRIELAGGCCFEVGDVWKPLKCRPDDPKGARAFGLASDSCHAFMLVFPILQEETMTSGDIEWLVGHVRQRLSEDQALIEVKALASPGMQCVFSIVKTRRQPSGVQYALTMDVVKGRDCACAHLQAFFDEAGMSGLRDSLIYEKALNDGLLGEERGGWMADPYDPECQDGYLMNLSERREYDTLFPAHPLSLARQLVREVLR